MSGRKGVGLAFFEQTISLVQVAIRMLLNVPNFLHNTRHLTFGWVWIRHSNPVFSHFTRHTFGFGWWLCDLLLILLARHAKFHCACSLPCLLLCRHLKRDTTFDLRRSLHFLRLRVNCSLPKTTIGINWTPRLM